MKYFRYWSQLTVILSASMLSSGCATLIEERAYVNDTLIRDAVTMQSSQPESESLAPEVRKLYAARLTSGHYAQPASAFDNPDAANRGPERLSDIETRAMMDVAVEFQWDKGNLVPAYRFIMTPYKNIDPRHVNAWSPLAVITLKYGRYSSAMMVAPLPPASQRLVNGRIVTPWAFCEACFESGKNGARVPEEDRREQYNILRYRFVKDVDSPHLGYSAGKDRTIRIGISKLRFMDADPHRKVGDAVFVTGATAVQTARQEFVSRSKARDQRAKQIRIKNNNYKYFLDKKYGPLHLAADLTKAGPDCDDGYRSTPNINQSADYNQQFIEGNYAFIDCAQRVLRQYDIAGYAAMYPDLARREQMLWERAVGAKREKILTPEGMVKWGQRHIEQAYDGIERIQEYNGRKYANQAQRQRQSNAMNALLASMNQQIAKQKTDNRQRQRQLDRLQTQARRARRATGPLPSSNATNPAKSAAEQTSNISRGNSKTSGNGTGSNVGAAQQTLPAETGQATTQIASVNPPEKIGAEPVAGGEQGCVALVEANRYPGKSALSSCLYSEPEREALVMKFSNSCGVPVNVSIDLRYDNGKTNTAWEYNIKPGKMRTTVGHCGAVNHAYRYEETSESVRARSQ